jgi:hypothetical protein
MSTTEPLRSELAMTFTWTVHDFVAGQRRAAML